MADKANSSKIKTSDFLPKFYQTDANKKFLQATVDQLTQPGSVKKVNGYIGRENAKSVTGKDIFVDALSGFRKNYQLEPSLVVKDKLDNVTFFKDYQDYINQLGVFGSNVSNHARLNQQEFYSWAPHIDWDKFVNFQNYYWLPYGPDVIKVAGQQQAIESTYTVTLESELDNFTYLFTPNGLTRNPTITLYKGQTYRFEISAIGNPFSIKTLRTAGPQDRYSEADNHAVETGVITITIPYDAPQVLYYVSENNVDVGGVFQILSIDENTAIDVEAEILGKRNYTLADGTPLSNGMKLDFIGKVTPTSYASGQYYVEGVGSAIVLIKSSDLELISAYTDSQSILFDTTPFDNLPFSDATSFAGSKDYITINRASLDRNPWSRYNRWFHKDTINASSAFNGKVPSLDQTARAVRPIIEFEAGLKLFNFGLQAVTDVDLVDTFTTDVFSTIEGQYGYNIDGVAVANGQRILFTADTDGFVRNNIYRVEFLDVRHEVVAGVASRQIHLVLEATPTLYEVALIKQGVHNQGTSYWYNGTTWKQGQEKTALNQSPLFDVVDSNGISFSDIATYEGSTFAGTKIFSYKIGSGTSDTNLGFALSYKNISNIGDIVFNFNLLSDTFQYRQIADIIHKTTDVGFLVNYSSVTRLTTYTNGWKISKAEHNQAGIRIYKNSNLTNNFNIDIFDDIQNLDDLIVHVYINGIRLDKSKWTIVDTPVYKRVVLTTDITVDDVLTIRTFANQPINENGYYEIPISLQNNPLNTAITEFTLGEVIDHVNSIVDNLTNFVGEYPGASNLRDLGDITSYGTKFVQHSGPASLSLYHITSEENNVIKAIEQSRDDYGKFKRNFISIIDTLGNHPTDTVAHVNLILQELTKDRPKTSPYYFSDMAGYGACIRNDFKVIDYRIKTYPLTNVFNLDSLSTAAVYIYLNGTQLLYDIDYTFSDQGFIVIRNSVPMANDDEITIYEYENTDACFIPQTPTKLGIWPKYEPKIYTDTSLVTHRVMIQGHDGSQVLAYGDYRDDLILELEKRIFNNIKVKYDPAIFDINDLIPSYIRPNTYTVQEFNEVLAPQFYQWTTLIDRDFTKPLSFDRTNPVTYNYRGHTAPDGREVPGYWRGIYRWMLDTDRPNLCPWESLGFTIQPAWWEEVYGPAPYTSDNLPLWEDLANGLVREPGKPPVQLKKYIRPFLATCIPVDADGEIQSPMLANLASGVVTAATNADYVFGDVSPVEATWRRSSYYPFSVLITSLLLSPAKTFGTVLDRSRIVRNFTGQLVYQDTGLRVTPSAIKLPSIYTSATRVQTAGVINYLVDYLLGDNLVSYTKYNYDLQNITANLSYRVAAFTSKEKFNLLLDSKSPTSTGSVFVPQDDYDIVLNVSSPVKKITYSGVVITKLTDGYEIKGYSKTSPYFKYYPWLQSGPTINVGGISESYSLWTGGKQYAALSIVKYNNRFYRAIATHTAKATFDSSLYTPLGALIPIVGGRDAILRTLWDRETPITVPYGTKFKTVQDVVDFLIGYGEWLKDQGFIFDNFDNDLAEITNWVSSAKEFMFWTTQNWSGSQDNWQDWLPNVDTEYQAIVKYNGDYYQAIRKSFASDIFQEHDFEKLDGLSTVGSSVISLSPSANNITFSVPYTVVDDVKNPFNSYEIFSVDGLPIAPNFLNSYRDDNAVTYAPADGQGLFGASFYLVQKEQVVILKNTTMFNDTIYNPESGYRQERIKVNGYVTTNWTGSFDAPGFIFDQAKISEWADWQDYSLGDIVKHKEFYYSANSFIPGTAEFIAKNWTKLHTRPTTKLLPNWTYKAGQFTDFFSLDTDNFDPAQQKMAQHMIGYQKRQYLENIIKDDVSEYKFYQGMIIEKGTQNVLNKLFDVLSAEGEESLKFHEEWAVRVGQYGASAAFENIEFVLPESQFKSNPQGIELINQPNTTSLDFIIRQTPNDIYLKPLGYDSNPWPVVKEYKSYLRTPGYVRSDEVTLVLKTIDEILTQDVTKFKNGSYVWCGFEGHEWNVYRYTPSNFNVTNLTYEGTTLTIELDQLVPLKVGSYIGIEKSIAAGFYKIETVTLNSFTVTADITGWTTYNGDEVPVFVFLSQRAASIDVADTVIIGDRIPGELLWTDDAGNGKWATWEYAPVYASSEIKSPVPADGLQFGKSISINRDGNISAISTNAAQVLVYIKSGPTLSWTQRQTIVKPLISTGTSNWAQNTAYAQNAIVFYSNSWYKSSTVVSATTTPPSTDTAHWNAISFADVLAMSTDGRWLAVGSPTADYASTLYMGTYNPIATYTVGQIVKSGSSLYEAIDNVPINKQPASNLAYWRITYLISVTPDGSNSPLVQQGVVSIYEKDTNDSYVLVSTVVSPYANPYSNSQPQEGTNELFGSTLAFADNTLFVGATGHGTQAGNMYQLDYSERVLATATYNPTGSSGKTIIVSSTAGIDAGMTVSGLGFTKGQTVLEVVNSTTILLNAGPDGDPFGRLEFKTTAWGYTDLVGRNESSPTGARYASNIQVSKDSSTVLVSAAENRRVYVYNLVNGAYALSQTIVGTDAEFGQGITVTDDGTYIAVASIMADGEKLDQGSVTVYKLGQSGYTPYQTLVNTKPEIAGYFGSKLSFMNDGNTIVVYSAAADTRDVVSFDNLTTSFDDKLTNFSSLHVNSGRVDIYDRYATKWVFSESLPMSNIESDSYGKSIAIGANHVFVGAPSTFDRSKKSGKVYEYSKLNASYSWQVLHKEIDKPDLTTIKSAFLYNKASNTLVSYIDIVDPVQGKIAGIADQEIKFKTFYDPATYSVGDSHVNVDDGMAWTADQVGMLWWDLRNAKFIDSYDQNIIYRNSTWNTLFPGASIDVYEWIETTMLPSEWDAEADTDAGIALGISGTSLYGDTSYSVKRRYDNISKTFKNTYYFWVKNKKTIPTDTSRHLSASDVAEYISNPRGNGYKYLALTSQNSFSLVNVATSLNANDVVLSVQYWTADHQNQNIHSQWKLISDDADTILPATIEQKWFDSLCGKDSQGRIVPDTALPIKIRYGIENRPRQGMFVNRFEALKQFVEHTNLILASNQVVGQKDLSKLETYENEPHSILGLYDSVLDTELELRFANVGAFKKPALSATVVNGAVTGVSIDYRGAGYVIAPYIEVTGTGTGAVIRAIINTKGQIIGVKIISAGVGYTDNTVLTVRNYSVLVHSDSQAVGNWSIYSYEPSTLLWSRVRSQSYDTRKYWSYIDWYATGYSQYTAPDFSVATLSELTTITPSIGNVIKVRSDSDGNWTLLVKYSNVVSIDYTQTYQVVGRQNGTIKFNSILYKYLDTSYGYDGSLFDGSTFDNSATIELRYILSAIKENIFIDTLKQEYLNLFFSNVRYAFSEQNYLDWIFKTSFVKAQHNVGPLAQRVTYKNDNLADYESYINEVKPYKTKVREYVSAYTRIETSELSVTDFDIPPIYENNKLGIVGTIIADEAIEADNNIITTYPWKHWLDNASFTITDIKLVDGGSNYHAEPVVRFVSKSGTGATARAFVSNGKVNRIILTNPGSGYLKAPTVILDGGLKDGGVAGKAIAVIGNSVVRSNLIKMKFDRLTQTYFITKLEETETFTGTGSRLQFPLTWSPDVRVGKSTVTINGIEALRDDYKLTTVKSTARGYTSYSGLITFSSAVAKNATVIVNYIKDWSLLNAADRVQYYYNPTSGEIGKDIAQLMSGVDYGGVIVNGLGFDVSQGWGSVPFYTDKWDSFDGTFDDYIVVVNANTHSFTLPYIPEANTQLNVYQVKLSSESYVSNGSTTEYMFSAKDDTPTVTVTRQFTVTTAISKGDSIINMTSTNGFAVGDSVSVQASGVFNLDTKIKTVNPNNIILDQIAFNDIAVGTQITFTRVLIKNLDYTINIVGAITLSTPATAGSTITIAAPQVPLRLDDINYGTNNPVTNHDAVMRTIIADGETDTVTIPNTIVVHTGDKFIIRKSTSDGSIKPQEADYDTALTGGNLTYSTASGLRADDIIVDGDGFVTPTTSPATEEVVPGQLFDTLALKIFDRANSGSATMKVDNFIADGKTKNFKLTQQPNSAQAIIVKVNDQIKTVVDDYTFNYETNEVKFIKPVVDKQVVSVFSFGFNGTDILDLDYFIGNGVTIEFVTRAPWLSNTTTLVYVDGIPATVELFETDTTYESNKRVGIRFNKAPKFNSVINYVVVNSTEQTFAVTKTERIPANGGYVYPLSNIIGNSQPAETNMIVRVGQTILKAPNNSYYKIGGSNGQQLNYFIDQNKFLPYSLDISDIIVIAGGTLLTLGTNYSVDLSGISIKLNKDIVTLHKGQTLTVSIKQNIGYTYIPPTDVLPPRILMATPYTSPTIIEVISSYKHDILDIQRTAITVTNQATFTADSVEYYDHVAISAGVIKLERPVIDENYVWITKSGSLLTPNIDYKLNGDRASITLANQPDLADEFSVITYGASILTPSVSYMQFKDMLNRVHYKRLSANKRTVLLKNLYQTDTTIIVDDASNFDLPNPSQNKPGVIEIRGERIEYFTITGNILGQLRRGTLGTSTPRLHRAGAYVQDIGPSETIPYTDTTITEQVVANGTNIVPLKFVPNKGQPNDTRANYEPSGVVGWFDQYGYNYTGTINNNFDASWNLAYAYSKNDVVSNNGSYFLCVTPVPVVGMRLATVSYELTNATYWKQLNISVPVNYGQSNDIEVFIGGYTDDAIWEANVLYVVGTIVNVGSYKYTCTTTHISGTTFHSAVETVTVNADGTTTTVATGVDSKTVWKFFIGNIRLKKQPYKVYNVNEHPESTEGDLQFDPEFAVDGTSNHLRLTTPLKFGTTVTVVKRTATAWDSTTNVMDATDKIGGFLKSTPGIWYVAIDKYENAVITNTFDSVDSTFDNDKKTFDQG